MPSERKPLRAGDTVYHMPSKETWVLAADEEDGRVICCGWPETIAKASDCELREAATDTYRIKMLQDVAAGPRPSARTSWAKRCLDREARESESEDN